MNKKKVALAFLASWAVLLLIAQVIDTGGLSLPEQALISGALACAVPLLCLVSARTERKGRTLTLRAPGSPEVLYRVEGEWICKGTEETASWYRKGDKIYGFASMEPLYRVKDNKVYRSGEAEPFLTVEGDKVVSCQTGQTVYDLT